MTAAMNLANSNEGSSFTMYLLPSLRVKEKRATWMGR
jgi:hypothetical protein